jgi:hypothetical protein
VFVPQLSREGFSAHPFMPRNITNDWLESNTFHRIIKKHLAELGKPDR